MRSLKTVLRYRARKVRSSRRDSDGLLLTYLPAGKPVAFGVSTKKSLSNQSQYIRDYGMQYIFPPAPNEDASATAGTVFVTRASSPQSEFPTHLPV